MLIGQRNADYRDCSVGHFQEGIGDNGESGVKCKDGVMTIHVSVNDLLTPV